MSRTRLVRIAALNITMSPHSPERYAELFRAARKLDKTLKIWGDDYGNVAYLFKIGDADVDGMTGYIYRFFNLDQARAWYDQKTGEPASEEELEKISIPDHLKPHLQKIRFVFWPKTHRLVFTTQYNEGSLSTDQAQDFFERFLNDRALSEKFPEVNVTVEKSPDALDRILSHPRITHLTVAVKRPNPDLDGDFEREVMEQMEKEGVSEKTIELKSAKGQTIHPVEETVKYARVATSNGAVYARVRDEEGHADQLNTTEHPRVETFVHDDTEQPFQDAFLDAARSLVKNIRSQ